MCARLPSDQPSAREGSIPVVHAALYYRDIGQGPPIILLHGGPDFDHNYFLPDMDRLADTFRLIYYDQRGRGKSGGNVQPDEVTLQSEMDDLERVMEYFHLESAAVLGHSWGGLLAMEYAIRHPARVSHLILMNTAPACHDDYRLFQTERHKRVPGDIAQLEAVASSASYAEGDLATDAAYYRIHFRETLRQPEQRENLIKRLRANVTPAGILKARAIEKRLYHETWVLSDYDVLPRLKQLRISTLVICGDHDFIPVECSIHIAEALPDARLVVLRDCGHFSYLERPDLVHNALAEFFHDTSSQV